MNKTDEENETDKEIFSMLYSEQELAKEYLNKLFENKSLSDRIKTAIDLIDKAPWSEYIRIIINCSKPKEMELDEFALEVAKYDIKNTENPMLGEGGGVGAYFCKFPNVLAYLIETAENLKNKKRSYIALYILSEKYRKMKLEDHPYYNKRF